MLRWRAAAVVAAAAVHAPQLMSTCHLSAHVPPLRPRVVSPSTCHISVHVSQVKTIEEEFWSIVNESEKEEGADGGAKEQNGFH